MQKRCSQKRPRLGRELALSSLPGQEPRGGGLGGSTFWGLVFLFGFTYGLRCLVLGLGLRFRINLGASVIRRELWDVGPMMGYYYS